MKKMQKRQGLFVICKMTEAPEPLYLVLLRIHTSRSRVILLRRYARVCADVSLGLRFCSSVTAWHTNAPHRVSHGMLGEELRRQQVPVRIPDPCNVRTNSSCSHQHSGIALRTQAPRNFETFFSFSNDSSASDQPPVSWLAPCSHDVCEPELEGEGAGCGVLVSKLDCGSFEEGWGISLELEWARIEARLVLALYEGCRSFRTWRCMPVEQAVVGVK